MLTTQYLEEADQLAERISVIDGGRIIAEGTADELKAQVGGDVVDLERRRPLARSATAVGALAGAFAVVEHDLVGRRRLGAVRSAGRAGGARAHRGAAGARRRHVAVADLALRRPSLDDVFLNLTGHHGGGGPARGRPGRGRGRRGGMIG